MRNAPHERIDEWIDRDCALTKLGVRPQTLYAYVSRGLLRARPDAADPRRSAYSGHDIDALLARKRGSRRRATVAMRAARRTCDCVRQTHGGCAELFARGGARARLPLSRA